MIYFRGCTARQKENNISDATEKLLKLAGVDYHILDDEKCCGSVLIRTGFYEDALKQIEKNTEVLKGETIITSCAGCYKTLKEDYEGLDVVHISQLLDDLIKQNKLNFSKKDLNVTFHDSCHLARHMNVFDEPRSVIESVADLVEMGGVKSAYPEIAQEMAVNRISQAKDTNSTILITTCPFCKLNLKNEDIEVLDLTEFLMEYGGINEE